MDDRKTHYDDPVTVYDELFELVSNTKDENLLRILTRMHKDAFRTTHLEAENKRLREGLEHYADESRWQRTEEDERNSTLDFLRLNPLPNIKREYKSTNNGYDHARNILNGDKENKLMNKCKCGHYWSVHRDRDYDADVAGSIPGQGSCTECDCSNFRPAPTEEQ